jgi:hypothetical protein
MKEKIKRIDIKEFRELGFLQEVNRQFFHPLGLALEVIIDDITKKETLGGIWDYREDPEGNFFANEMLSEEKMRYVADLKKSKVTKRYLKGREYGTPVNLEGHQIKVKQ